MSHAVAFGEQNVVEHRGGNIFEVVGAVGVGGAVEVGGTDTLHGVDVGVVEIFAAAEHEMFKKMGKAGLARFFVFGADVVPGVNGDDGSFVVFVNKNGEAVGEDEFTVRDVGDLEFASSRPR